jgi:hypothetical protein
MRMRSASLVEPMPQTTGPSKCPSILTPPLPFLFHGWGKDSAEKYNDLSKASQQLAYLPPFQAAFLLLGSTAGWLPFAPWSWTNCPLAGAMYNSHAKHPVLTVTLTTTVRRGCDYLTTR